MTTPQVDLQSLKMPQKHTLSQRPHEDCTCRGHNSNTSRLSQTALPSPVSLISVAITLAITLQVNNLFFLKPAHAQQAASFPGVSRDLASFCSARPSLSIDLAPMIVHVKRNTSFNYKLYLFSNSEHVFQTGQVVPRDDFRIHSFPVKLKPLGEFIPQNQVEVYQKSSSLTTNQGSTNELVRVPSSSFNYKQFFSLVPLEPIDHSQSQDIKPLGAKRAPRSMAGSQVGSNQSKNKKQRQSVPFDVHGDVLPGDESIARHDVASLPDAAEAEAVTPTTTTTNANEHIQFDRDDQLAVLSAHSDRLARELSHSPPLLEHNHQRAKPPSNAHQQHQMVMPVGSFSSFHVNLTYLARKDFDQREAQVARVRVDPARFQVSQVHLLSGFGSASLSEHSNKTKLSGAATVGDPKQFEMETHNEDYAFLSHKLLRDPNTRITSIMQIYEDWITRNYYTIVYVQRRLISNQLPESNDLETLDMKSSQQGSSSSAAGQSETASAADESASASGDPSSPMMITDRLVFRGSSTVLLGADQLDYHVKASAFVTEKNGLHYYLEFLPNGKFFVGAIDWSKRPFKFMDSRGLPIKQTRTLFDNEELLLCPPSVCYSEQPIDEIVSYGRLSLGEKFQRDASILSRSSTSSSSSSTSGGSAASPDTNSIQGKKVVLTLLAPAAGGDSPGGVHSDDLALDDHELLFVSKQATSAQLTRQTSPSLPLITTSHQSEPISLDALIEAIKLGSSQLNVRLHLRDWVWPLPRIVAAGDEQFSPLASSRLTLNSGKQEKEKEQERPQTMTATNTSESSLNKSKFAWHFEWAKRNEVKVLQDTYGFALTGHEIDASYRVFNELYLISANQLISINYTLPNETVTSVQPVEEEFPGLSSTLLDPITGAFYDRYSNQIYFFKGDRYVGFDYATKRPLEDFLLPSGLDFISSSLGLASRAAGATTTTTTTRLPPQGGSNNNQAKQQRPLVSSLPVVGILGRQHHVDAIYHDFQEDLIYVFSGMKFYTHRASDFKDGAFKAARKPFEPQIMRCINEHFLEGCRFDEAYPNPCRSDDLPEPQGSGVGKPPKTTMTTSSAKLVDAEGGQKSAKQQVNEESQDTLMAEKGANFSEEQQRKLRTIATRGRGLIDLLLENTLIAQGASRALEPFLSQGGEATGNSQGLSSQGPRDSSQSYVMLTTTTANSAQERIVIYLLIAMVLITIMVTVAMIIVILNWAKTTERDSSSAGATGGDANSNSNSPHDLKGDPPLADQLPLEDRLPAYPPAISQYLNNQYHAHNHRQQLQHGHLSHRSARDLYFGGPQQLRTAHMATGMRRSSQPPLPSPPPPTGPKPAARIPFRSYVTSGKAETIIDSSAL